MSTNDQSLVSLCRLVAYLVSNTAISNEEWMTWGLPFVKICIDAQFEDKEFCSSIKDDIDKCFCPLIGQKLSLYLTEENEKDECDSFIHVHDAHTYVCSILEKCNISDNDFDEILSKYFENFYVYALKNDVYDARSRTIIKRMCKLLGVSSEEFVKLEDFHWKQVSSNSTWKYFDSCGEDVVESATPIFPEAKCNNDFSVSFNREAGLIPTTSVVKSFRLWRVAFIAAAGGAMMSLATKLAVPSIMNLVIPLLSSTTSIGQISFIINSVWTCTGLTTTGFVGSFGAAFAGYKMLKRTEPIKEFTLEPLHVSPLSMHHSHVSSIGHDCHQYIEQQTSAHGQSSLQNGEYSTTIIEKSDSQTVEGFPIFILIPGHFDRGSDIRSIWGANGVIFEKFQTIKSITTASVSDALFATISHMDDFHGAIDAITIAATNAIIGATEDALLRNMGESVVDVTVNSFQNIIQDEMLKYSMRDLHFEHVNSAIDSHESQTPSKNDESTDDARTVMHQAEIHEDKTDSLHDWEELVCGDMNGWWRDVIPYGEEYILYWARDVLENLNDSIHDIVVNKMKSLVVDELLKFTTSHALHPAAGLQLTVLNQIKEIDDPWVVAIDRSTQAGKLLARVLIHEYQYRRDSSQGVGLGNESSSLQLKADVMGESNKEEKKSPYRPITLMGYGMGARVIFHCLEELSSAGVKYRGIVENAVLIGAPAGTSRDTWSKIRSVVSGRLVNVFSTKDWVLALLYRSKSLNIGVAGLCPVHITSKRKPEIKLHRNGSSKIDQSISASDITVQWKDDDAVKDDLEAFGSNESKSTKLKHLVETLSRGECFRDDCEQDVENYDVSDLIVSHADYPKLLPTIIAFLNLK